MSQPSDLVSSLHQASPLVTVELRPPRVDLSSSESMDAWIDTYHAVRGLTRRDTFVFVTDSAVGAKEEDNLRHLEINIGPDAPRGRIVPFLTSKHSLAYCLAYAARARDHGFQSLVVLGGDRHVGVLRCVEHACELRGLIRKDVPDLALGGWANPHADAIQQVGFLIDDRASADFYLTQIVSHHDLQPVERFLNEAARRGLTLPGLFGVFLYRSAHARTLEMLRRFFPVPRDELTREFREECLSAEDICARSLYALLRLGLRHFYISNLPSAGAQAVLERIVARLEALSGMA